MATYNRYPAMDAENNFPPQVRTAISTAPELVQAFFRRGEVAPLVNEALRFSPNITAAAVAAAEDAFDSGLLEAGIVSGRAIAETGNDSSLQQIAYRHTDSQGNFLPLGYTVDGRLDAHARKIWSEDLDVPVTVDDHPDYAHVIVTQDQHLLIGIRWDGGVDIPGGNYGVIANPGSGTVAPSKMPLYQEGGWKMGSDILPAYANKKLWSGWGSSSMEGLRVWMSARATELGSDVVYYNGSKGGEKSDHVAARLGSVPAQLSFPNNTIPASGTVSVLSPNMTASASLKPFTGWVTAMDGTQVHGTVSSTATVISFTRTTVGSTLAVSPSSPFIPEEGPKHRGDTAILWMGKNNITQTSRVISDTDASYEYFVPLVKRILVLGHFMNTGQGATNNPTRDSMMVINKAHADRYGDCYFDVSAYLTSSQLWTDTGITPTAIDLAEQALGNKPPSISSDAGHMNAAGYDALSKRLKAHMQTLGWY